MSKSRDIIWLLMTSLRAVWSLPVVGGWEVDDGVLWWGLVVRFLRWLGGIGGYGILVVDEGVDEKYVGDFVAIMRLVKWF